MNNRYRVYFKIGNKKLKMDVSAVTKEEARAKVRNEFTFLKTDYIGKDDDTPNVVKDIFSYFNK